MARARSGGADLIAHDRALGVRHVAGADEAGRGALAGPIVAAAVLLDVRALDGEALAALDDSKRLTPLRREALAGAIVTAAEAVAVVSVGAPEIDAIGIQAANLGALSRALDLVDAPADAALLVDGFALPMQQRPHRAIVKGDATSAAVAAASVIAKVTRDRAMAALDAAAPGFGFGGHAGYGTAAHMEAITRLGPCPAHRRSFAPIALAA